MNLMNIPDWMIFNVKMTASLFDEIHWGKLQQRYLSKLNIFNMIYDIFLRCVFIWIIIIKPIFVLFHIQHFIKIKESFNIDYQIKIVTSSIISLRFCSSTSSQFLWYVHYICWKTISYYRINFCTIQTIPIQIAVTIKYKWMGIFNFSVKVVAALSIHSDSNNTLINRVSPEIVSLSSN